MTCRAMAMQHGKNAISAWNLPSRSVGDEQFYFYFAAAVFPSHWGSRGIFEENFRKTLGTSVFLLPGCAENWHKIC